MTMSRLQITTSYILQLKRQTKSVSLRVSDSTLRLFQDPILLIYFNSNNKLRISSREVYLVLQCTVSGETGSTVVQETDVLNLISLQPKQRRYTV